MIEPRYPGKAAALFASGPSLSFAQVEAVRSCPEIIRFGCNDAYRMVPDLHVLYAADAKWISAHNAATFEYPAEKLTAYDKYLSGFPGWRMLPFKDAPGLSDNPEYFHTGSHSGFALINLAYLMGIRRIMLLGYDGAGGGQHFFGPHPPELFINTNYEAYNKKYEAVAHQCPRLHLKIVNATPGSAVRSFPHVNVEDAVENYRLYRDWTVPHPRPSSGCAA